MEAIPGRLDDFVATVNNYVTLRRKPNRDKKVAIFYFKGPGQSAMVASGMDVAPSLYNMLTRLRQGRVTMSTACLTDAASLERLIAANGRVFNEYAKGVIVRFRARQQSPADQPGRIRFLVRQSILHRNA